MDNYTDTTPDMNTAVPQAPSKGIACRVALGVIAVLLVVASTVTAVLALQAPEAAVNLATLASPADMQSGKVYYVDKLYSAGVFMYTGAADEEGVPRNNGKGKYIEKEHILSYLTLALIEDSTTGTTYLLTFAVSKDDGEIFDRVATHDREENENGDNGQPIPVTAYLKATALKGTLKDHFTKTEAEYKGTAGMENVKWVPMELEYYCGVEEDYTAIAAAEKRDWLRPAFALLPIAALLMVLVFRKSKPQTTEAPAPAENCDTNT